MKDIGEKKFVSYLFFCHKIQKIELFYFEMLKKKIWANFQRIIELFTQKIVTKLSKIWVLDPRSGIRKKPFPDLGSRGQKGTGSRIRIRNTGGTCILIKIQTVMTKNGEEKLKIPALKSSLSDVMFIYVSPKEY
jgi:hypothetical protein